MREAINSNPMLQAAVIGFLLLAGALMMATQVLSKKGSAAPATAAPAPGLTSASAAVPTADPTAGATATGAVPPTAASQTASALTPGPGLPRDVIAAYARGDTIALLVVDPNGIDDRLVRGSVEGLKGESGVAVFVTDAKDIARYARITLGVGVNQVPALVVVRPREGGGAPQATVQYGFRDSDSVVQAVRDARYKGRTRGYDPG